MELKPTTKVAEALAVAQRAAQSDGNPEITPAHLVLALAEQPETTTPALLAAGGTTAAAVAARPGSHSALPRTPAARSRRRVSPRPRWPSCSTPRPSCRRWGTPTCPPTSCCSPSWRRARSAVGRRQGLEAQIPALRGGRKVTSETPESQRRGVGEVRHRPDPGGPGRQARPRHRARLRDPPGGAGPQPADEEQPGPHRRARRRQDRGRRGPGPAHRRRRRARVAAGQAAHQPRPRRDGRGGEVPR